MAVYQRAALWILGAVLAIASAGCSHGGSKDIQPQGTDMNNIIVTERDHGRTLTLSKGDTLTLRLEGIAGTGYSWYLVRTDAGLMQLLGEPQTEKTETKIMGGPNIKVFRFKAIADGTTVIELQYKRIWEKDVEPLRTFSISVEIR